jgi:hypothetical protein
MVDLCGVVAVTLPVRNGAQHLQESIQLLLSQSYENIRLLICDNASTDATPDIASDYARRDKRVKLLRFEEGVGVIESFNRAFEHTDKDAQFFQWATHDDYWEPDFVRELVLALERTPGSALAFCHYVYIEQDGSPVTEGPAWRLMRPKGTAGLSRVDAVISQIHTVEGRSPWYGISPMSIALKRRRYVNSTFPPDVLPMCETAWMGTLVIVPKVLYRCRLGGLSSNKGEDPTLRHTVYCLDDDSRAYIEDLIPEGPDRRRILAELQNYFDKKNAYRQQQLRDTQRLWRRVVRRLNRWRMWTAKVSSG